MHTKTVAILCFFIAQTALATEEHKHGGDIFHAFRLETDLGESRDGIVYTWDFDGWIGGDTHRVWLRSEGEKLESKATEQAEYWVMYSRNVATFWDAQIGIRYDEQPNTTGRLVAGFEGLAPYFFETEAHVFVSEEGDISARLMQENNFLITQRLIIQPYVEINLFAQDVLDEEVGSGITDGEFGIQTRYEISRKFAPYVDVRYERKFGKTSGIAQKNGERRDDFIASLGLRLML